MSKTRFQLGGITGLDRCTVVIVPHDHKIFPMRCEPLGDGVFEVDVSHIKEGTVGSLVVITGEGKRRVIGTGPIRNSADSLA